MSASCVIWSNFDHHLHISCFRDDMPPHPCAAIADGTTAPGYERLRYIPKSRNFARLPRKNVRETALAPSLMRVSSRRTVSFLPLMLVAASLCRNGAGEAALPAVPPSRPAAALLDAEEIEQIYSNLGDRGFIGTGEREGGGGDDLHGKSRALVHGDAADRQSPSTGNTVDSIADNDEFLLCSLGRALWTGVRLPLEMAATASRRILALQRALAAKCAPPVDRTLIMGRVSSGETSLGGSDALCVDDEAIARELQAQEDEEARAQVAAQEHHRLALAAAFAGTEGKSWSQGLQRRRQRVGSGGENSAATLLRGPREGRVWERTAGQRHAGRYAGAGRRGEVLSRPQRDWREDEDEQSTLAATSPPLTGGARGRVAHTPLGSHRQPRCPPLCKTAASVLSPSLGQAVLLSGGVCLSGESWIHDGI